MNVALYDLVQTRSGSLKPIQELLSRIRWDPAYAQAKFELGYYDRVLDRLIRVPFHAIRFPQDDHFAIQLADEDGVIHTVPLHRIREVYRDGELIWQRPSQLD